MAERKLSLIILGKATSALAAMKSTGDAAQSLGKRITNLLPSFKQVALAGTAAFGAVAAGAYGAVRAAAQDQESQKKLADQLRRTTGATDEQIAAVERFISKQMMLVGVTDDQLRPAMANLVRATGDASFAQQQLSLALDVSAATGKDLETVSLALGKAFTGNMGALTKLGIPLDQAVVKSKNLNEIINALNGQFGGAAAAAADTFSGRLRILQVSLGEAVEGIGYALLPIAERLVAFLQTKVVPVIQVFADTLASGGGLRDALLKAAAQAGDFGLKVVNALEPVVKGVITLSNVLTMLGKPVVAVLGSIAALVVLITTRSYSAFKEASTAVESLYNGMDDLYVSTETVGTAFQNFRDDLAGTAISSGMTQESLRALEDQAKRTASATATVVQPFVGPLLEGYGASALKAKTDTESFEEVLRRLQQSAGGAGSKVKTLAEKLAEFGQKVRTARDATYSATDATNAVGKASDDLKAKTDAATAAQERFNNVVKGFPAGSRESIDATRRLADAQRNLRNSGLAVADAVRDVTAAEKALADLRTRVADSQKVAGAERDLSRSKFGVEEANFAVVDAERRLAEVRSNPNASAIELRRAEIDLEEAKLAVSDSIDRLREAERRLNEERDAAPSADEIAEAERNLERAKYGLEDALDAQRQATEEQAAAQDYLNEITNGATEGSVLYTEALRDLTDAKTAQTDASTAYTTAMRRERDALTDLRDAERELERARGTVTPRQAARTAAGLGVSLGAGGSIVDNIAAVSSSGSVPVGGSPIQVNLNVQAGISNPVETANEIIDALRQWERANGSLPLASVAV